MVTQTAIGVDLASNAHIVCVVNDGLHIRVISANGQSDVDVGSASACASQGDPDFATTSAGVTYMTFTQLECSSAGEGRDVFLAQGPADNGTRSFSNPENISNNRVDDYAPRMSLDRVGKPHIAWAQQVGDSVQVAYWNEALASPQTVVAGDFPSIFVDQSMVVHLVYTRDNDLFYNNNRGGQFSHEIPIVTTPLVSESSPSIGVDPDGNVLLCYESNHSVYFAVERAGAATFQPPRLLDRGGVSDLKMRVRRGGKVAIVYVKQGDLAYIDGQSSTLSLPPCRITDTDEVESHPSLDIDLYGNLHVSFIRTGQVFYINNAGRPNADFSADHFSGEVPLTVHFSDLSSGEIQSWAWDLGDGTTSPLPEPVHTYTTSGQYDVRLTVTAAGGRVATIFKDHVITAQNPSNVLTIPDQTVLPGQANVWFPVLATHDEPVQGFQLMGTFDPNFLTMTGHSLNFTATSPLAPEFLEVNIFETYFEVGCIFDFSQPFTGKQLAPGARRRIMNLLFDIENGAPQGQQTQICLVNNRDISRIFNIFTVNSFSVLPVLGCSTITVLPVRPPLPRFFMRGDVDSNRRVELTDAISLLNYLFLGGTVPRCLDAADFQDSGKVELTSAIAVLNFLFLGGPPPAVPFPSLGIDPTPDNIPSCR